MSISILKKALMGWVFFSALNATAQVWNAGVSVGGLGAWGNQNQAAIGGGLYVRGQATTFWAAQVDVFAAKIDSINYWSLTPAMLFFISSFDELKIGALGGLGFYQQQNAGTKFGMNYGGMVEMAMSESLNMGFQARLHSVFAEQSNNLWTLLLTLGWKFGGSW